MPVPVKVSKLPSFTVASLGEFISPNQKVTTTSREVGDRLLKFLQRQGLKRHHEGNVRGLAMINADWASYIASGASKNKHIPLYFVQGVLLGQNGGGNLESFGQHLAKTTAAQLGLGIQRTPAGSYAVARAEGSYAMVRGILSSMLNEWLPSSGYQYKGGPVLELYLNTIEEVSEDILLTDVCVPVTNK